MTAKFHSKRKGKMLVSILLMKKWNIPTHFPSLCGLKKLEWKILAARSPVMNYGGTHNEFSWLLGPTDSTHSKLGTMLRKTPIHLNVIKDVQLWAVLVMGVWCLCFCVCCWLPWFEHLNAVCS